MVMLIDINALSRVLDSTNAEHEDFKPIKTWFDAHGCFIFGGTKYKEELSKTKYLKIFNLYKDQRKIISICDKEVDFLQQNITSRIDEACDDPHLLALLAASNCSLICSVDIRAFPYFKKIKQYCPQATKVKIYSRLSNQTLLPNASETAIRKNNLNNTL